ncbi:hypothetical protein ACEWY4_008684 [Coilia grayii]|uniref:Homeobox domain-containing protein n=1 Tax=Coilia grayii TaxID=363190 RepID=A0ABD1KBJ6_9TELE
MEVKFSNFTIDHILARSGDMAQHSRPTETYNNEASPSAMETHLYHSSQAAGLNGFRAYGMPIALPLYKINPPAFSFCSDCCYRVPNFGAFVPSHPDMYETGPLADQMCCPHVANPRQRSRMRTVFTECQTKQLDQLFSQTDYPSVEARAELARNTGLTEETVRVWFKNRRARRKRQNSRTKSPGSFSDDREEAQWSREEMHGIQRMSHIL